MARPQSISNEQILAAAREVFGEYGFTATTAEIARRAGISEGTLFKRFPTKEALFEQVTGLSEGLSWFDTPRELSAEGEAREVTEQMSLQFIARAREVIPRMLMLWSRGHAPPLPRPHDHVSPVERVMEQFAEFFRRETERGQLADFDADVLARALVGSLMQYVMQEVMHPRDGNLSAEHYVHALVSTLWSGISPRAASSPVSHDAGENATPPHKGDS